MDRYEEVVTELDTIYDTRYTETPIKGKFLILAYGAYMSGSYMKENLDYHVMYPHFDLDFNIFNGYINVSDCDKIWLIKDEGVFEEIL